MEKNLRKDSVVPSATLVDMEGYVVNFAGAKVHNGLTEPAMGVVFTGFAADKASEIAIAGRCPAYVDGASAHVAKYDPLVAAGTHSGTSIVASVDGVFHKATVGTHQVRAVALEITTTLKLIDVYLIGM